MNDYFTQQQIKDRGWSKTMIDKFLKTFDKEGWQLRNDGLTVDKEGWKIRNDSLTVKLYAKERVYEVEHTQAFKEEKIKYQKRVEKRRVNKEKKEILSNIKSNLPPVLPIDYDIVKASAEACFKRDVDNADILFYIVMNQYNIRDAINSIKKDRQHEYYYNVLESAFKKIAEAYPELEREVEQQLRY